MLEPRKRRALLTIDFEDYRRQELRDHLGRPQPAHPDEVKFQLDCLLQLLDTLQLQGTFFSVGRLVTELPSSTWQEITRYHRLGCHGYEHLRVAQLGPARFYEDLTRGKSALEERTGKPIISFRAPYYSSDDCDPWFGEALTRAGFKISSSKRIVSLPPQAKGAIPLPGGNGLIEIPFPCLGYGQKRLTVIGGTYFRLLPLGVIKDLLLRVERQGFIPMVYLHNYDIDPTAAALQYPRGRYWRQRLGDYLRRAGRTTAGRKLKALCEIFDFGPIETVLTKIGHDGGNG